MIIYAIVRGVLVVSTFGLDTINAGGVTQELIDKTFAWVGPVRWINLIVYLLLSAYGILTYLKEPEIAGRPISRDRLMIDFLTYKLEILNKVKYFMKLREEIHAKITVWALIAVIISILSSCASVKHETTPDSENRSCALPFNFADKVIDARIIMIGDLHGTHETPWLAAELACTLASKGAPVTLAIEMPHDEQAALNAYLATDDGDDARKALIARPFWQLRRDGLNTVATMAMIDRIRLLRQGGDSLAILPIDASSHDFEQPLPEISPEHKHRVRAKMKEMGMNDEQQAQIIEKLPGLIIRERAMAKYLVEAIRAEPDRQFVVLLGNGHTSKLADVPLPGRPSMSSVLLSQIKSVLSLNTIAIKYSFWGCLSEQDCGFHEFEQPMPLSEELVNRGEGVHMGYTGQAPQGSYDGTIIYEHTTPARPASMAESLRDKR